MSDTARQQGYDACYDGKQLSDNPHEEYSPDFYEWERGFEEADNEMRIEAANADDDDFHSGRWTREDTESMERGRDLPRYNDAGEPMF